MCLSSIKDTVIACLLRLTVGSISMVPNMVPCSLDTGRSVIIEDISSIPLGRFRKKWECFHLWCRCAHNRSCNSFLSSIRIPIYNLRLNSKHDDSCYFISFLSPSVDLHLDPKQSSAKNQIQSKVCRVTGVLIPPNFPAKPKESRQKMSKNRST